MACNFWVQLLICLTLMNKREEKMMLGFPLQNKNVSGLLTLAK